MEAIKQKIYRIYRLWNKFRRARLTLGVRAMVLDEKRRVCLVRHSYKDGWFLPGGSVKTGESLVEAVQRELKEETGIALPETPQKVHGVFSSFHEHKSDHVVVFVISDWTIEQTISSEIAEVGFFAPGDLPEGASSATTRRIKEFVTGVPPGHRW